MPRCLLLSAPKVCLRHLALDWKLVSSDTPLALKGGLVPSASSVPKAKYPLVTYRC